jgi:natural product biosynthesis luciferase-like monooxygenase protein
LNGVFIGDGTLLIHCAEVFLQKGGTCKGIVTLDGRVSEWAINQGIPLLGTPQDPQIDQVEFDWLFSVANLTLLPDRIVQSAARGAINFHDGPLPGYAGLNVPAWAIMAMETEHAVSWHEMTSRFDAGRVLATRVFPIAADETSVSLNAKCYEAGLESFRSLMDDLFAGQLRPVDQVGTRHVFVRSARPAGLAVIDFGLPSARISALVRGLNFGGYENELSLPKIWTGSRLLAVDEAVPLGWEIGRPGTVRSVSEAGIEVFTADGYLRLSGFKDFTGRAVSPTDTGIDAGQTLPSALEIDGEVLTAVGRDEAAWAAALGRLTPSAPPFLSDPDRKADAAEVRLEIPPMPADTISCGFLAWLSAIAGKTNVSAAFHVRSSAPALSSIRPISIEFGPQATCESALVEFASTKADALSRSPMAVDLILRISDAARREAAEQALSVAIAEDTRDVSPHVPRPRLLFSSRLGVLSSPDGTYGLPALSAMAKSLSHFLRGFVESPETRLADLALQDGDDPAGPTVPYDHAATIHGLFAAQTLARPDAIALECGTERLSYSDLDRRSQGLASALRARGAGPGQVVGVCLDRSVDLIIALLAVLRSGAAYLPLDPAYPQDRLAYMVADSGAQLVIAKTEMASRLEIDPSRIVAPDLGGNPVPDQGGSGDVAYLIYTSGSTGRPKGVIIPHRNVINFFAGMDAVVPFSTDARLLSVTSVSFDISVLEIFWTLTRGATLVLQTDMPTDDADLGFSLFYFASEASGTGHHAYRLLIEGARFADANGFEAIWTPERHFHAFGGLYPNPAISSAMLAGMTRNVKLRAGSSVLPLHHPIRLAEDWALVDNLSNGRAGIAIASGWQPNDFVLRPEAFLDRKQRMIDGVDMLRRLWRGEPVSFPNHKGEPVEIEIHPKPMQAELPLWITAAGNPETFIAAGELGCGVLTHLLGQDFEELAEKIRSYRVAWAKAGHPGKGQVTLMLHTFVGDRDDAVREAVRAPMKGYLKSAVDLVKRASWTFPTIVERATAAGMSPAEMFEKEALSEGDLDALLDHAFDRYYQSSGLFGTVDSARDIVRKVAGIGVDEIACLIDFGVDTDLALANLPNIKLLMDAIRAEGGIGHKATTAEDIVRRRISHLQCTPSLASILVADAAGRAALGQLDVMMVGGEALPVDLARTLRAEVPGALLNMYGPTETTIWSSVAKIDDVGDSVPLGAPIANTTFSIRNPAGARLPDIAEGELWIGGDGVASGYLNRPELTAEKFVRLEDRTFYRTGDLVRRHSAGHLDFLGRLDNQVKLRGHRIELGEIEASLMAFPEVGQAVVTAFTFAPGDTRLVGYVTASSTGKLIDTDTLRGRLVTILPDVMVPAHLVVLDAMPLTPNGKIDRKALPHPVRTVGLVTEAADEFETTIAAIWGEALGIENVSVTGNFFDLGGHSLLVVQVQRRMKETLGRDIAITDIFRFPTVRSIAAHLGRDAENDEGAAANRGAARAAARMARRRVTAG